MSKKRMFFSVILVILGIAANIYIITKPNHYAEKSVLVSFDIQCDEIGLVQLFYSEDGDFTEENSLKFNYESKEEFQHFEGTLESDNIAIRLDFPDDCRKAEISNFCFSYNEKTITVDEAMLNEASLSKIKNFRMDNHTIYVTISDRDSSLSFANNILDLESLIREEELIRCRAVKIATCIILDVLLIAVLLFAPKIISLPMELFHNRQLILKLAKNDFKTRYAGSYLGIFWAFIQPIVTIVVYWFVFEKGLHAGKVVDKSGIPVPFVLWLTAGLVPWFFFSEALPNATNALLEYSYLVKKVVFKISILPIIKVISALFVHGFFVLFTIVLFAAMGYKPDLYVLQVIYYSFCMFIFVLALSYATSAIVIFFRDLTQIINIILQIGMWMTPIMWQLSIIPEKWQIIFKLNPMYYIIDGYRNSLIYKEWIWEHFYMTIYFWGVTLIVFGIGTVIFKRLKPHFADVL
jgi:teichoic acid transport system permease protein